MKGLTAPEAIPPQGGIQGVQFISPDGKKVVQFRLDGFSFHKLKPYQSWELLKEEAMQIWKYYLECAKPLNVKRAALRYVNQIDIPLPFKNLEEYILTVPPNSS